MRTARSRCRGLNWRRWSLDGGAGVNEFKLRSDDSLVTIGDSLVKLSEVGVGGVVQAVRGVESYLGGALDSKVELAGLTMQKVDLDLGEGADLLKLQPG